MNKSIITAALFVIMALDLSCGGKGEDGSDRSTSAYLGMKPPGTMPVVFAPGIVSTDENELDAAMTRDGSEFYFSRRMRDRKYHIMVTSRSVDGSWSVPEIAPFSGTFSEANPFISPDGKKMFFISRRPEDGYGPPHDIFVMDRTEDGWSEPFHPDYPLNTPTNEIHPSVTSDGTVYYVAELYGGAGRRDVYRCRYDGERYLNPELVPKPVSSEYNEGDPYIAPDESYLIFVSVDRPGGFGSGDLYISFRDKYGEWSEPRNLGATINSKGYDYSPVVTHDGEYFFFTKNNDVYWVSAKILEDYRD
ncbi:MAG: PD40 domain-containing protein [Candidatus Krumholzibacteria bacterium]|nr:PD40 domain-containing protein [Candidatus Krumholzibacteria bacterium]